MSDFRTVPFSESVLDGSSVGGGASLSTAAADRPEEVGPYRIIELLGEGGMGEVYKAERCHPIRQTVAVKIIKLGFDSREIVGRFESERQALALMDHPGIAKVLDAGATGAGRPYFVMDFVAGKPITSFCDENRLSIEDRLKLFADVCDAIAHAHTKAIIHRDIKPSNVMAYHQDGRPATKVIDFGIAKALANGRLTDLTVNTQSGHPIGTYDCMSPEQVEGSPDIDTRTDVYSLGVLLYELLTGATPFDQKTLSSATDAEIKRIIREVDPPRPSTRLFSLGHSEAGALAARRQARLDGLARQLRGELEWIPLKAMRKDRARRYGSPLQLKEDIENYLDGKPLLAGPESRSYRFKKFVQRNARGVAASAAVFVLLIVGITLYIHNIRAEQRKTQAALVNAEEQTAISDATTGFLMNMLASADPDKQLGDKVTVLQATEVAVKDLDEGKLKNQPKVEASIRTAIGNTQLGLGRYDAARPNLQRAVELRRQVLPAGDPQFVDALGNLATVLMTANHLDEAEPLLREALDLSRKYRRAGHTETARCLNNLAGFFSLTGKLTEAEPLYRESLAINRAALSPSDPDLASNVLTLAGVLYQQGKFAEAEPLFVESLKLRRAALPAGHPNIAEALNNLAMLQIKLGKFADAEAGAREALAINRATMSAGHPLLSFPMVTLGDALAAQNKFDEAEAMYREALDIRRKALPAGDRYIGTLLSKLGALYLNQDKPGQAEAYFRELLEDDRKRLPADHPDAATSAGNLAVALARQGKFAQAEPLYRESLKIRMAKFGPQAAPTTQTAGRFADMLDRMNRPDEAAAVRRQYPPTPPTTGPAS
jgi:serine/threonine protein kinase/Flp pilus assembly protein TadD